MEGKYNSSQFKSTINSLEHARSSVAEGKAVHENFGKLKEAFDQVQPGLKVQAQHIKNFLSVKNSQSEEGKAFENKRQVQRLLDLAKTELLEMLALAQDWLWLGKKERKKEQEWEKLRHEVQRGIGQLKNEISQASAVEIVLKLLNARDSLFRQMLRSLLYRKCVLWMDLNVPTETYVHGQVKALLASIREAQEKHGFVPTLPEFQGVSFGEDGRWRMMGEEDRGKSLVVVLNLLNAEFNEMLDTIRNYSNLNGDPQALDDINKNAKVVKSLRQRIEDLAQANLELEKRLQETQAAARPDAKGDKEMRERLEELEVSLTRKEAEVAELRSSSLNSNSQIHMLKQKLKALEEENQHIHNSQLPKLQEMSHVQQSLSDLFTRLKKDIDTYATMFSIEGESKRRLAKDLEASEARVEGLVQMLQREKIRSKDLRRELARTDLKCLQIMKAREEVVARLKQADPTAEVD